MAMLKVQFARVENVVLMQVLEQAEWLRGSSSKALRFAKMGKFALQSVVSPQLTSAGIFVRGSAVVRDHDVVCLRRKTPEDAANYILQARALIERADLRRFAPDAPEPPATLGINWQTVEVRDGILGDE